MIEIYENLDGLKSPSIEVSEALDIYDADSLIVEMEAIHAAPYATRNYTRYTEKCLKDSTKGWISPYNKPLILHHNEKDGEIIGRVIAADYKKSNTFSGTGALILTVNVPDEKAKTGIKNGLNQTVSIGLLAEDVRCSICGKPIEVDNNGNVISCEHVKGEKYDGETAYWDVHKMSPKEVSYVIVPSDQFAKNIKYYPATKNNPKVTESLPDISDLDKGEIQNMDLKEMEEKLKISEEKVSGLTSGLKSLTESKEASDKKVLELEESLDNSKKEIAAKESEISALKEQLSDMENTSATLGKELSEAKEQIKVSEEKVSEEIKLRESLEKDITEIRAQLRESMISELQALRRVVGKKPLAEELVKNREISSIRDSIDDLKIELSENKEERKLPGPVESPALSEEADESKDIKVEESVDLRMGLANLFNMVAGAHK